MKRCPTCNRFETDDALVFCRADGTVLVAHSGSFIGDAGTAKFGSAAVSSEIETSILPQTTSDPGLRQATAPTIVAGEKDRAIAELNKSYEKREYYLCYLKVDQRFDPLRSDPRFVDLVRRVGLPQ
jgi:hypothetical protein